MNISRKENGNRTSTQEDESDNLYKKSIEKKESITYSGFIAQEVEEAAKKAGYNFSGVKKPQNDKDNYGLTYSDFVVPLVKAVQEQQVIIEKQQQQIDLLMKRIEALERSNSY